MSLKPIADGSFILLTDEHSRIYGAINTALSKRWLQQLRQDLNKLLDETIEKRNKNGDIE